MHEYTDFIGRTFLVACVMKDGVVLRGMTGNPEDVVIDAQGKGWGFWFHDIGSSTGLEALTVRHADWAVAGYGASPWFKACIFEDNGDLERHPSMAGAGMYFDHSESRITNCIFRNNTASSGAGAAFSQTSNVRMEGCLFVGNHATTSGGGFVLGHATRAVLVDTDVIDNTAGERGGGIYCGSADSLGVRGGSITGNTAGVQGGGVGLAFVRLGARLQGVTVLDNVAPSAPQGFVWDYSGTVEFVCGLTTPSGWVGLITFAEEDCPAPLIDAPGVDTD
jgi:predicted outer membrane repeat protein